MNVKKKKLLFQREALKEMTHGAFLVVQWLRLHASTSVGTGSIPSWGSSTGCKLRPKKPQKTKKERNIKLTNMLI